MQRITLPISKSIANRLLILQAMSGQPLLDLPDSQLPEDVQIFRRCLQAVMEGAKEINVGNCGTAMRFLTAYCAQREGQVVIIRGDKRMNQRPMVQEVAALISCGADIGYMGEFGFPPLRILGKRLHKPLDNDTRDKGPIINGPASSQFVSALQLVGFPVQTDCDSPYIRMTQEVKERFAQGRMALETDWSSAAFWYEYVALHGGSLHLEGLRADSIQGDKMLIKIYKRFGVTTSFDATGATISKTGRRTLLPMWINFEQCPDLYPAIALTCKRLGVLLIATHTEMLRHKESDRIISVRTQQTNNDHRIAMALLAADIAISEEDQQCIGKSYPTFYSQLCALQ